MNLSLVRVMRMKYERRNKPNGIIRKPLIRRSPEETALQRQNQRYENASDYVVILFGLILIRRYDIHMQQQIYNRIYVNLHTNNNSNNNRVVSIFPFIPAQLAPSPSLAYAHHSTQSENWWFHIGFVDEYLIRRLSFRTNDVAAEAGTDCDADRLLFS